MMELRPYQQEAREAVKAEWKKGNRRTLLVMVTGGGKTIIFSKVIEDAVREGKRVLVLAHRGELLQQAADKLEKSTGLGCAVEKAEETSAGTWFRVIVGSVQTLTREKRLKSFPPDYFQTIIVDEAHHAMAESYQRVLRYFESAEVLGVTATPDRADMKDLGAYFQSLAYEYGLAQAIREKYLAPIRALTIPIKIDISNVKMQNGDYAAGDLGDTLTPYLDVIADEIARTCAERKVVIFLPLVKTAQKMCEILRAHGLNADEVNGESMDRAEKLAAFERGDIRILCNAMLLTEGWDCPSVDTIIVLRPTKSRSLYCQMIGRGTRLCPNKEYLLLLDFLWLTQAHSLCHPASLIAKSEDVAEKMTERLADAAAPTDIQEAEEKAESDVVAQREEALASALREMRKRKRALVDPLQFAMSIQAEDLSGYVPAFGYQSEPMSGAQKSRLEKAGIFPDEIENAGQAELILSRIGERREKGLTTPKQIRFLESRGFNHVGTWQFDAAKKMIDRIAVNGWRVPAGVTPAEYKPAEPASADAWEKWQAEK